MEKIDLRQPPSSCIDHPLVWLKKKMKKMCRGDKLLVITDPETVPLDTIKILASKEEIIITRIDTREDVVEVLLEKR
ncbi:MAG: hypothetical protein GXO43_08310 [Crenarchaeota archaeon]|nr:hypothetical protein [Thermoproteota archaeon]